MLYCRSQAQPSPLASDHYADKHEPQSQHHVGFFLVELVKYQLAPPFSLTSRLSPYFALLWRAYPYSPISLLVWLDLVDLDVGLFWVDPAYLIQDSAYRLIPDAVATRRIRIPPELATIAAGFLPLSLCKSSHRKHVNVGVSPEGIPDRSDHWSSRFSATNARYPKMLLRACVCNFFRKARSQTFNTLLV